nr:hypothetical protein GCM10025732_36960 [Glycomyces mayteni]
MTTIFSAAVLAIGLAAAPAVHTPEPGLDTEALEAALDAFTDAGDQSAVVEVRDGDEVWAEGVGPRSFKPTWTSRSTRTCRACSPTTTSPPSGS